jgi:hypothetical protein
MGSRFVQTDLNDAQIQSPRNRDDKVAWEMTVSSCMIGLDMTSLKIKMYFGLDATQSCFKFKGTNKTATNFHNARIVPCVALQKQRAFSWWTDELLGGTSMNGHQCN